MPADEGFQNLTLGYWPPPEAEETPRDRVKREMAEERALREAVERRRSLAWAVDRFRELPFLDGPDDDKRAENERKREA